MRRKAGLGAIQKRKVDAEKFKYVFLSFVDIFWKVRDLTQLPLTISVLLMCK